MSTQTNFAKDALAALKRAAKAARKLSIETGTPFWVMKDGKIVDLNAKPKRKLKKSA
ncbi:MAG: hypothetical protein IT462_05290 [Planctomycetes bacterium]|nr:hypothetical protein [Planctomycetota bacterium]